LIRLEEGFRAKGRRDPIINSGATAYYSPDIELFKSLDKRYAGTLGTAGKSTRITRKGVMRIPLSNRKVVRLSNVLYILTLKQMLLLTQILYADEIFNEHIREGYRFFRDRRRGILAIGYNVSRISYLG
jgi:hypothetical protein